MRPNPMLSTLIEDLPVEVFHSNAELGRAAAQDAADAIRRALAARGAANIILATGNSQLTFLETLRQIQGIDWSRVQFFHMDEYLNLQPDHPASFPRFLQRHFLDYLQPPAGAFHPVQGRGAPPEQICWEYARLLRQHPADLCALGYGENGHLAFNDPPYAEFDDPTWVKVIKLDLASRRQQVGEGHFPNLDAVPTHAITLTIPALLAAKRVLAIVPEARKAPAVQRALFGAIDPACPGSILRRTPHAHLYLDRDAAALAFPAVAGAEAQP